MKRIRKKRSPSRIAPNNNIFFSFFGLKTKILFLHFIFRLRLLAIFKILRMF